MATTVVVGTKGNDMLVVRKTYYESDDKFEAELEAYALLKDSGECPFNYKALES